ncbi:MAG: PilZ domain-containing protein [Candidatus Omnitrophica bacterium]|nr:PilZ domain-containing protein [Candidatus Omnitrophota bacterium]
MTNKERRRAARIKDEDLSLKLNVDGFDMTTHTLNISSSGLYCKVDRELPLMSRVRLVLMIPNISGGNKEPQALAVDGVIVRAHPVIIGGKIAHYDVAIFFESLDPAAKETIAAYIARKKVA